RLTVWPSPRLGLETAVGVISNGVHLVAQNYASGDTTGTVKIFSERLIWNVTSPEFNTSVYLAGGIAYVTHDSPAYEGVTGTDNVSLGLGAGLRFHAGRSTVIKLEVEDYIYSTQFTLPDAEQTEARGQNDLMLTVGMAIRL